MKHFVLGLTVAAFFQTAAQQWKWAYPIQSSDVVSIGNPKTDSSGFVYVTGGSSNGPLFVHSASGTYSTTESKSFIARYSPSGNLMTIFAGVRITGNGGIAAIATDKAGNAFVTGVYNDTICFGSGNDTITRIAFSGGYNAFTGKLDNQGKAVWLYDETDSCGTGGIFIQPCQNNNVIQIGTYNTCDQEEPDKNYIRKINGTTGVINWEIPGSFFHTLNYTSTYVTPTLDDAFLVHGYYAYGAAPFAGLTNTLTAPAPIDKTETYLVKYDLQGNVVWLKTISGTDHQFSGEVIVDNNNDIIFSMYSDAVCNFNNVTLTPVGNRTTHLIKCDQNGNYLKHLSFNSDGWGNFSLYDIKTDHLNNIFVTANMDTTFKIGTHTIYNYQGANKAATAIIKFDPQLNYQWSQYASGCCLIGTSIAIHDSMIYMAGTHDGTFTLNNSAFTFTNTGPFKRSAFIAALKNDLPPVSLGVEKSSKSAIQIYPNPATDKLFISGGIEKSQRITIYNLTGEKVLEIFSDVAAATGTDISQLQKGIYILQINTANGNYLRKLVVD
jgi:hypothetical protein